MAILFVSFVGGSFGGIGPVVILFVSFVGSSFGGIGPVIITIAILKCAFGNERVVDRRLWHYEETISIASSV